MTLLTMWLDVRDAAGKLLFRYDPQRDLVEIKQHGGGIVTVGLSEYRIQTECKKQGVDIAKKS